MRSDCWNDRPGASTEKKEKFVEPAFCKYSQKIFRRIILVMLEIRCKDLMLDEVDVKMPYIVFLVAFNL
jgi:hypothetical protein